MSALIGGMLAFGLATPAIADTAPLDLPNNPPTVSADPLPTVQIDGVVWSQVVVGNTVYVAGSFSNARPAGAAAGVNTTTRNNLLSYNLTTGALISTFDPNLNAQANVVAASPDGSTVYVGGDFTTAGTSGRARIAAYSTATGQLIANFKPSFSGSVKAIVATKTAVYVGGSFTSVTTPGVSYARSRVAAIDATTGAVLAFDPSADAAVNAMTFNSDKSKLIIGGRFQTVGGTAQYGMAALDPGTGLTVPWLTTNLVRDAGDQAGIISLASDADGVYGSGFVFGAGGNLEGSFRADNSTGAVTWIEDCHGDTYSVFPTAGAVYITGHPHYCGNIGGFPQTSPAWTFHHSLAFSKDTAGTITNDPYGYYNWAGSPRPNLLYWYPNWTVGTYTKQYQATWSVAGSSDGNYVVYGGEFPTVNGVAQQGLVRFAARSVAPNKSGPVASGFGPTVASLSAGTARIAFKTTYDRDNQQLTYKVYRNFTNVNQTPICTFDASNPFWAPQILGCKDTGLTPGQVYKYRVVAFDPLLNRTSSSDVSVTITGSAASSPYADAVQNSDPTAYYRLDESSGTAVLDSTNFNDMVAGSGVTRGAAGAMTNDSDKASNFDGTANGNASTQTPVAGPDTFTTEAWIKTTTTGGGKIIGFGNANTGLSSNYDRQVYMDNAGHIYFGVYNGTTSTVNSSKTYNDGAWHLVTASMSSAGMRLSVDGKLVSSRSDTTSGQVYNGYWRIGGDNLGSWPGQPNSNYFAGTIDDVAIYPIALSTQQVATHYVASGRANPLPQAPADAYGAAIFNLEPDHYWRLGDASGTTATDSGAAGNDGNIYGGVTLGATGAIANTSNTAATFNGSDGVVVASTPTNNPTTYTETTWFKTTTTNGGKLMGFGNASSGLSSGYDRHIYMESSGQLTFGTWTGQTNTTTSPLSYNDGNWHFMAATQSSDGLMLYVDGVLVGTNPQTQAQDYTGYWRIGGDTTWSTQPWFNGSLDDAAVFSKALTAAQISQLNALGAGVNAAPTADFTSTVTKLSVDFDASASADADGSIASYAWDFGDGTTGTGKTPTHNYASAGTYTVTLTVTDNGGKTATTTKSVTTISTPKAVIDSTVPGKLKVDVDGSNSTDSGSTLTGYSWDFGDGSPADTTMNPAVHTYTTGGDKTIILTVTDASGNTDTATKTVTVVANVKPTAAFTSTANKLVASFNGTGSSDSDGTVSSYAWDFGDGGVATTASAGHTYTAAGTYTVKLTVTDNDGATDVVSHDLVISQNVSPTAAFSSTKTGLTASFDASASTDPDGTVSTYSWNFGDGSALGTGKTPTHTYTAGDTYTAVLTVTDDDGGTGSVSHTVTVAAPPVNVKPTAVISNTTNNLAVAFTGSGSTDSDGTITDYLWNFGDGTTSTTANPNHTYTAADTYTVTLKVTDNGGLSDTATKSITVSAAPPANGVFASAEFGTPVTGGFGAADTGGAWTVSGGASNFAVAGGTGQIKMASAGAGPTAFLNAVSTTDTDLTADVSLDKAATGGGTYVALIGRGTTSNAYRGKVLVKSNGGVTASLARVVSGAETTVASAAVAGLTYATGDVLHLRVEVVGTSSVTLKFKAWKGATEPAAWSVSATDAAPPSTLQSASGVGVWAYLSGTSTNSPVVASIDHFSAKPTMG